MWSVEQTAFPHPQTQLAEMEQQVQSLKMEVESLKVEKSVLLNSPTLEPPSQVSSPLIPLTPSFP